MKIALVAAGSASAPGGQSVQADLLVRRLREAGHEAELIPIDPAFPAGLGWVRRIPWVRTVLNQLLYLPSLMRLRRADVAQIFSASYASFFLAPVPAIAAAKLFGRRVVLNYHSGEADDHLSRHGAWAASWLRRADALVVPSPWLREVFAKHGHDALVIPNAVDLSRFTFRSRADRPVHLLCTRNLEPIYRVDVVLRAFSRLRKQGRSVTLTIAGSGSREEELRRLALQEGVAVRFAGSVSPSAMPRLYEEADLFLNASVVDNQPMSILEAFASGTPVVTTGAGGIPALVSHEQTGLLVPENDPESMAQAVARLIDDPALGQRLARQARELALRHAWSRVGPAWMQVLSGEPPARGMDEPQVAWRREARG